MDWKHKFIKRIGSGSIQAIIPSQSTFNPNLFECVLSGRWGGGENGGNFTKLNGLSRGGTRTRGLPRPGKVGMVAYATEGYGLMAYVTYLTEAGIPGGYSIIVAYGYVPLDWVSFLREVPKHGSGF